jgi:predicted metal-dependent phosphoesterase TrpH
VVARAKAAGIELLALSDHDSVAGVDEALDAARALGRIRVVGAVELSSIDDEAEDLHILGYAMDHHAPAITAALEAFREDRSRRADRMLDALRENGWAVDDTEVRARQRAGEPVGRPHLAQAAFGHPANAERLADEGLKTATDLLVAELIDGRPSFRRRTFPTVPQAIDVIHEAGGVAVWAHPFWDVADPGEVVATIDRFAAHGLDGVECFYVEHDEAQTRTAWQAAADRGLLRTGSADFHGPEHPHFSRFGAFELHGLEPVLGPIAADH